MTQIEQQKSAKKFIENWSGKGYEKGETKRLSVEVASRLFPVFIEEIKKQKDGDALLIAEYAKRRSF